MAMTASSRRHAVNVACEHLLPDPGFACYQHRRIKLRHAIRSIEDLLEARTAHFDRCQPCATQDHLQSVSLPDQLAVLLAKLGCQLADLPLDVVGAEEIDVRLQFLAPGIDVLADRVTL